MRRFNPTLLFDAADRSFWLLPALAMIAGGGLGFALPALDDASNGALGIFTASDSESARSLLETIAVVTVSVAGITFSVTVVALQLAAQQLSPRVLRTFQTDHLNHVTLAVFLGVFVYALVALGRLGMASEEPNLVLTAAVAGAIVAFALFTAFIHNVVVSLQAETVIRRIGDDARPLLEKRFPKNVGAPAEASGPESEDLPEGLSGAHTPVRASRAGFFNAIEGDAVIAAAREEEGFVTQCAPLGRFVLSGETLLCVRAIGEEDRLAQRAGEATEVGRERTLVQDLSFPLRQLADIALRGLSPGMNDETTAETAMSELTDLLACIARETPPARLRADVDGTPRFAARVPEFDELVELGFAQVVSEARGHPVIENRLLELLGQLRDVAEEFKAGCTEIDRQAGLLRRKRGGTRTDDDR